MSEEHPMHAIDPEIGRGREGTSSGTEANDNNRHRRHYRVLVIGGPLSGKKSLAKAIATNLGICLKIGDLEQMEISPYANFVATSSELTTKGVERLLAIGDVTHVFVILCPTSVSETRTAVRSLGRNDFEKLNLYNEIIVKVCNSRDCVYLNGLLTEDEVAIKALLKLREPPQTKSEGSVKVPKKYNRRKSTVQFRRCCLCCYKKPKCGHLMIGSFLMGLGGFGLTVLGCWIAGFFNFPIPNASDNNNSTNNSTLFEIVSRETTAESIKNQNILVYASFICLITFLIGIPIFCIRHILYCFWCCRCVLDED